MACSQPLLFRKILKITEPLPVQTAILVSYVPRGRASGFIAVGGGRQLRFFPPPPKPPPTHLVDLTLTQDGRPQSLAVRNAKRSISTILRKNCGDSEQSEYDVLQFSIESIKQNAQSSVHRWTMPGPKKMEASSLIIVRLKNFKFLSRSVHFFFLFVCFFFAVRINIVFIILYLFCRRKLSFPQFFFFYSKLSLGRMVHERKIEGVRRKATSLWGN